MERIIKGLNYLVLLIVLVGFPQNAFAYIGPGAGFAFLGSAFVFILTFFMALATLAFWPLQFLWRLILGKKISKNARTRRVVIVGLDGLEPKLAEKLMDEGRMPNLKALKETGAYSRLGTTLPALSPVAWSTFQTGVNPGAHNIFDFLTRDKRYCLPELSSTDTELPKKTFSIGKYIFPLGKAKINLLRKSQPFWKILAKNGIFSNIIRVPISYPPEKFSGNILSAMCVPDLKGTQGSFSVFTSKDLAEEERATGGTFVIVNKQGNMVKGVIEGPPNPFIKNPTPLAVPFTVTIDAEKKQAQLEIHNEKITLKLNEFSEWITLNFKLGFGKKISGICRFCIRSLEPDFFMYVTPININPAKPALPIAHPIFFSSFLAKRNGVYGTLGLMEDTWGRNEYALDDRLFLDQAYLNHEERKAMFFDALERTREGVCACVFDATDRIQHMFWRYLDDSHPSPREGNGEYKNVIPDMYEKMDGLIGEVKKKINKNDVLIVLSDHGFTSFRRCININTWLYQEGYLALKEGADINDDYLQNVDWSKTRAFAIGLTGIYINRKGREKNGIVSAEDAETLKAEISAKLEELRDPQNNEKAIMKIYDSKKAYHGIYQEDAPDLIIGSKPGYRVSWESVTGGIRSEVFDDNLKAWSGDHDVDPREVPGVFFTNRKLKAEQPNLIDIAPTVLDLFAVPVPKYMEGKVIV